MKVQIIERFGDPDVFTLREIPKPKVIPGHVLIRVHATSINPIDIKMRQGLVPHITPKLPTVLHGDVAGIVEEVGEGVHHLKIGDEVFGCAGGFRHLHGGALADYLLADAQLVVKKPRRLSFHQAAALPLVAITAWEGLSRANLQPGQKILVHGGTGGVGHIVIQLAKIKGAKVYTTVSTEQKAKIAKQLGADETILYPKQTVEEYVQQHTDGKGFDIVFDTVGGQNLDRSFAAAKLHGTVVAIATRSSHDLTPLHNKGLTLHVVFMVLPLITGEGREHYNNILQNLQQLVDEEKITPLLDPQTFTFSEVAQAHRYFESGQAIGKVVLRNE